ncbi:MAG TPA: branched-chain amino acid ABC transporter permease [Actinomycetota bacterium]
MPAFGPVPVRSIVRAGIGAVLVLLYLALVGLLDRFAGLNLVGEHVTLGRIMLVLPPAVAGFVVTRARVTAGERRVAAPSAGAATGAATGVLTGVLFGAAVLWAEWFDIGRVRQVFVAASPSLIQTATFEQDNVLVGAAILAVVALAAGALGGLARTGRPIVSRAVLTALGTVVLMGLLQRIIPVAIQQLGYDPGFLYDSSTRALTYPGAIGAAVIAGAANLTWHRRGSQTRQQIRETMREQPVVRVLMIVLAVAAVAYLPQLVGSVISQVLGSVMVFVLLGLGLNIVVGYAGLLDLGYVAFYAFGAYMLALLTGASLNTTTGSAAPTFSMGLNFYLAVVIVAVLAAGVGLLIGAPVLRLRGDYLAIVTLGLGEIVSTLTQSQWLQPLVGGPQGMRGVSNAAIAGFGFRQPQRFYYLAFAFVLLAIFVSWRLQASRIGRAWNAMREDEQVADAMGISTMKYKLLAFAMGGFVGSLGGALFAVQIGSLTPASFEIIVSITALAVVIMGGLGSIPGVVVGAAVLIGLPGLLREFEEFRLLIYGAALVAIMVLRPQGLLPNVRRMRELETEEEAQDEWMQRFAPEEGTVSAAVPGGRLGVEDEELE